MSDLFRVPSRVNRPIVEQSEISPEARSESPVPLANPESLPFSGTAEKSPVATKGGSEPQSDSPPNTVALWLRSADQMLLGTLLIALLVLLVLFRWKLSGGWQSPIEISSQQPREYYYTIDVNKASWVEWAQLDGIGEKLARRIVADRDSRGPFISIEDVRRVRGLGPKLIEKIRPFLKCSTPPPEIPNPSPSDATQPH